ncbi:hypothetical protein [Streptomyces sp. NPDC051636]|uniref:hypothetical protein n=1 Tax=Streptomyces sp. NPDC051636 TaxID=3365663 RepID=UPI0037BA05AC
MGNAYYEITRKNGERIAAGYSVEAVCEDDGCNEKIDRGLAHLCGNEPGGDEYGCGGYFCAHHLFLGSGAPVSEGLCRQCSDQYEAEHPDPEEAPEDGE